MHCDYKQGIYLVQTSSCASLHHGMTTYVENTGPIRTDSNPSNQQAMQAGYKPSPLGYGSPRSSPFRRPESSTTSPPPRQTTPDSSPSKFTHHRTPSGLGTDPATSPAPVSPDFGRPRPLPQPDSMASQRLGSPLQMRSHVAAPIAGGNALSRLQPQQLRVLRDVFQILDRDGDGSVNREDVADMMNQLGKTIGRTHRCPHCC